MNRRVLAAGALALVMHVGFGLAIHRLVKSARVLDDEGRIEFVIREVASSTRAERKRDDDDDEVVVVERVTRTLLPAQAADQAVDTPTSDSAPDTPAREARVDVPTVAMKVHEMQEGGVPVADGDGLRLRPHPRTLLERVVIGGGDRTTGEAVVDSMRVAPPHMSDADRLSARLNGELAVKSELPRGAFGKSGFVASVDGGYVRRDLVTGERPRAVPAPAGDVLRTMDRSGVFRDEETPLVRRHAKDDLVPTKAGGFYYAPAGGGFTATILPNGAVAFDENLASASFDDGPELYSRMGLPSKDYSSGSFSFTDAAHRLSGSDPYRTAKMCFLDDTQEIRLGLRERHQERVLASSMAALRRSLDSIWNDASIQASERRRLLFETWDECNEGEAGRLARDVVETFIRAHLPRGSALAYSDVELEQLNAARMTAIPFVPYGT